MKVGDRFTDINGRVRVVTDVGDEIGYLLGNSTAKQYQSVHQFHADTVAKHVHEETSPEVASVAGKLLQDPETPPEVRSVAASALTQAPDEQHRHGIREAMKHLARKSSKR